MSDSENTSTRSILSVDLPQDEVPDSHPRAQSLRIRNLLVEGVRKGITSQHGLIAHGRGEAFDYLLGERTQAFAQCAIAEAARCLRSAKCPVISVNGNVAALAGPELVRLASLLACPLEVNIFHPSDERVQLIKQHLLACGASQVLLPEQGFEIAGLASERRKVNSQGIYKADVVLVPLEDGDRAEALVRAGKQVLCVDLNPLSRTARLAQVTIVDNLVRALPELIALLESSERASASVGALRRYDNREVLAQAEACLRGR